MSCFPTHFRAPLSASEYRANKTTLDRLVIKMVKKAQKKGKMHKVSQILDAAQRSRLALEAARLNTSAPSNDAWEDIRIAA